MPSKESKAEIINQAFAFHTQGNIPKAIKYYETFIKHALVWRFIELVAKEKTQKIKNN